MFQQPKDSLQTNFYGNRQHLKDERCVLNATSISGTDEVGSLKDVVGRGKEDIGVGRMCGEFEARLYTKPVDFLPKGRREKRRRERTHCLTIKQK